MKLEELFKKVINDEKLRKLYKSAVKEGKLSEFLSSNGCSATIAEVKKFLESKKDISDELKKIVGGNCDLKDLIGNSSDKLTDVLEKIGGNDKDDDSDIKKIISGIRFK